MKVPLGRSQGRTVLLVDLTPMFVLGAQQVLDVGDIELLTAGTAAEGLDLLDKSPELLVVDSRILAGDLSLLRRSGELQIPVVLVAASEQMGQFLPQGTDRVLGIWDRDGDPEEFRRIVAAAIAGESIVSSEVGAALLQRLSSAGDAAMARFGRLTIREREILNLMADGAGNRAIAEALFISENTVRNHVRNVLDKLQASTRTEAVVRAVRAGLVRLG